MGNDSLVSCVQQGQQFQTDLFFIESSYVRVYNVAGVAMATKLRTTVAISTKCYASVFFQNSLVKINIKIENFPIVKKYFLCITK